MSQRVVEQYHDAISCAFAVFITLFTCRIAASNLLIHIDAFKCALNLMIIPNYGAAVHTHIEYWESITARLSVLSV